MAGGRVISLVHGARKLMSASTWMACAMKLTVIRASSTVHMALVYANTTNTGSPADCRPQGRLGWARGAPPTQSATHIMTPVRGGEGGGELPAALWHR